MATLAGRPSSSYRLRAPAPAAPQRWRREEQWPERPGVAQFLYLSLLLHAIAILLFGAPAGGSREGRAMWGALNVVLTAPAPDIVVPSRLEPIVPMPLTKIERELKIPAPEVKVVEKIIVPPRLERIAAPPLKLDKALPTPKIEAPLVSVPAPMAPFVPDLPRVEQRVIAEPPKIVAPLAQPVVPPVKERAPAPTAEIPRIETQALPTLPAAPALPAMEQAPVLAEPPKPVAPPPPVPEAAPKVEPKPAAPVVHDELPAQRTAPIRPPTPVPAPVETRPSDPGYDPTRGPVDHDAVRNRASQLAREGVGQRALLPFPMPAPPERKTKTEEALDKARKPDCRTAYKDMGLLAAVPLIANEFGEGTCRW